MTFLLSAVVLLAVTAFLGAESFGGAQIPGRRTESDDERAPGEGGPHAESAWPAVKMLVLVPEDEMRMAESVKRRLEAEGHRAIVVHTGSDGLETALGGHFDAIILDVLLPRPDRRPTMLPAVSR